jgi:hypothetical protein
MTLSDIAADLMIEESQQDRQITYVDETSNTLFDRLREHESALPTTAEAAQTIVETYQEGACVGETATAAGVAPITAAKLLHRCGIAGVSTLTPTGRQIITDWIHGKLSRTQARQLSGADDQTLALAVYIETHEPIAAVAGIVRRLDRVQFE